MQIEKSGWAGRAKAALALSIVAVFSLILMQCNATVEEQVLRASAAETSRTVSMPDQGNINFPQRTDAVTSRAINLPVLPETVDRFQSDLGRGLHLVFAGDVMEINGSVIDVDDVASTLEQAPDKYDFVVAYIDRDQPISAVRELQSAFRKANHMKFLYLGSTRSGKLVEMPFLLPPLPGYETGEPSPIIDEEYARTNNIALLKLNPGNVTRASLQQTVYNFVSNQVADQNSDYVVSVRFDNDDNYNVYLTNLFAIKEAFYQLYDERAQAMYGEHFWEISADRTTNEEHQRKYDAVRQGVPMAISVAEG